MEDESMANNKDESVKDEPNENKYALAVAKFLDGEDRCSTIESDEIMSGTKLDDAVTQRQQAEAKYAQENKPYIIAKAKEILAKKGKGLKKEDIMYTLASIVAIGTIVGVCFSENDKQQGNNAPETGIEVEADKTGDEIEANPIGPQMPDYYKKQSQGEQQAESKQPITIHYVVDAGDVFQAYEVENEYGYINFRDNSSTKNGNVKCKINNGDIVYIQSNTDNVSIAMGDTHNWKYAAYYLQEQGEFVWGYVDADLLVKNAQLADSLIINPNFIQIVNGDVSESEEQLDMHYITSSDAVLRSVPGNANANMIKKCEKGSVVFTLNKNAVNSTGSGENWRSVLYFDGSVYRLAFVEEKYLSEEVPVIQDGKYSEGVPTKFDVTIQNRAISENSQEDIEIE